MQAVILPAVFSVAPMLMIDHDGDKSVVGGQYG